VRKLGWLLVLGAGLAALAAAAPYDPMGNETINYSYDAQGRLTNVTHAGSINNNLQANYTYDKGSNRVTVNVTGAP
jgi:succinate dehydrogenase/fumarate reductase flavoprotein subunit